MTMSMIKSLNTWIKFRDGWYRVINEDYTIWTDNVEVIHLMPSVTPDTNKYWISRTMVRFTEYFSSEADEIEPGMELLKEGAEHWFGQKTEIIGEIGYYCVAGWSYWASDEHVEDITIEQVKEFITRYNVPVELH
jgi:hypothetical protein